MEILKKKAWISECFAGQFFDDWYEKWI